MREDEKASPRMLNSWKEIALYFDRGVRTVQRWEHELALPIHRIGKGKRSPVYALVPELKFWVATVGPEHLHATLPKRDNHGSDSPREQSHRLLREFHELVHLVAENSVRQRRQAELLQKRILALRKQLRKT